MNLNDHLVDIVTQEDLTLNRVQASMVRQVQRASDALRDGVADDLKRIDPTDPVRIADQRKRVRAALEATGQRIDFDYTQMERATVAEARELIRATDERTTGRVNAAIGAVLLASWLGRRAPKSRRALVDSIIADTVLPTGPEGAVLKVRFVRSKLELKRRIADALTAAVAQGRKLSDTLSVIRGNPNVNYANGIFHPVKGGLERLIKTAHSQYVQGTRLKVWERNEQVLNGVQALAVLDNRTSVLCRVRNGMAWRLPNHERFPGTAHAWPGPPPWHYLCRSSLMPIVRSLDALRSQAGQGLRDALDALDNKYPIDGQPAQVLGLDAWITRSEREGIDVGALIGRGRLEQYKKGHLTPGQLVSQQGRERTVKELKSL